MDVFGCLLDLAVMMGAARLDAGSFPRFGVFGLAAGGPRTPVEVMAGGGRGPWAPRRPPLDRAADCLGPAPLGSSGVDVALSCAGEIAAARKR